MEEASSSCDSMFLTEEMNSLDANIKSEVYFILEPSSSNMSFITNRQELEQSLVKLTEKNLTIEPISELPTSECEITCSPRAKQIK